MIPKNESALAGTDNLS